MVTSQGVGFIYILCKVICNTILKFLNKYNLSGLSIIFGARTPSSRSGDLPCTELTRHLISQKSICLDTGRGLVTTRCTSKNSKRVGRQCSSCDFMSEEIKLTMGTLILHCSGGDCKSFNLIYGAQCTHYIGKTTQPLGKRVTQHRNPIATISSSLEIDDTNTLAAHCIEHSTQTKTGFNSLYKFFIMKYVEMEILVISEQFFINKYLTYREYGLNVSNPIGLTNHCDTDL